MKIVGGGNEDLLRLLIEKNAEINAASKVPSSRPISLVCHSNLH
jgi:hypothetical protein